MMMIIDADYFKSLAALPDGFERINRMFGEMMHERDDARDIAAAAGKGYSVAMAANREFVGRVMELEDRTTQAEILLRDVVKTMQSRTPEADAAADFLGIKVPTEPAVSGNDGEA